MSHFERSAEFDLSWIDATSTCNKPSRVPSCAEARQNGGCRHRPRAGEVRRACGRTVTANHLCEPVQQIGKLRIVGSLKRCDKRSVPAAFAECMNSVTRMHQARHRHLTQPLLIWKRLYWNCRPFHEGNDATLALPIVGPKVAQSRLWNLLNILGLI